MRSFTRRSTRAALALLAVLTASSCAGGDQGQDRNQDRTGSAAREVAEQPTSATPTHAGEVDPDDFVRRVTNPYMPLEPGTTLTYRGSGQRTVVEVTDQTRRILGVTVTVVRDRVYEDGEVIEDTRDWFAQDREGNVWYFGEDSKEMKNGKVTSTEGSWEAGKDGASPGIVMLAGPQPGEAYAQENAPGVAEDRGEVLSLSETIEVPFDSYQNVLQTKDTNALEPDVVEHKFYARGVGLVAEREVRGGDDRSELVDLERP